jgi:hypothetical protein
MSETNRTNGLPRVSGAVLRAWISPVVAITFLAVSLTGVFMLSGLRGGVRGLHETAGVLFAIAGIAHLVVNWRPFLASFRTPAALASLVAAAALCLAFLFLPGAGRENDRSHGTMRSQGNMNVERFRR